MSRNSVLKYKDNETKKLEFSKYLKGKSFLPLIIPFHDSLQYKLMNVVKMKWLKFINSNDLNFTVFNGEMPQIVFKRGRTIGNMITSSKVSSDDMFIDDTVQVLMDLENENFINKVTPCGHKLCKCCFHICNTSTFNNRDINFDINSQFNCNSIHVIYIISCVKCSKMYVGQTGRSIKDRLNNHRSDIKLKKVTAVSLHFNEPHHNINHLKITPIEDISSLNHQDRLKREHSWMVALSTIYPQGLNYLPLTN
jgi:hypothetical protein